MKSSTTTIVRKLDELGRIVIPIDLRRQLQLTEGITTLQINLDGDRLILEKYEESCIFCDGTNDLEYFKDKPICSQCRHRLSELND